MRLASSRASASRNLGARSATSQPISTSASHLPHVVQTERRMVEICQGQKSKNEVLAESIERYKEMFMKTKIEFQKLLQVRPLCFFAIYALMTISSLSVTA